MTRAPEASPTSAPGSRRALFVDRDGTLNPDLRYLDDPDRLEIFRGVGAGLRLARDHGFRVICVTNQSGIERGFYTRDAVDRIHARLREKLRSSGAWIDAFYYCPHAPESDCPCRKPGTRLFQQAADDFGIDLGSSAIIGDRALDIEAGQTLGLLTALVAPPGHEAEVDEEMAARGLVPEIRADSLISAVLRILARG